MFLFALLRKVHIIPGKNLSGILEEKSIMQFSLEVIGSYTSEK